MNCTERGELAVESRCTQWSAFCWTSSETQGQHRDRKIWKVTVVTIVISCSFWQGVDSKKLTVTVSFWTFVCVANYCLDACCGEISNLGSLTEIWPLTRLSRRSSPRPRRFVGMGRTGVGCMTGSFSIFFFSQCRDVKWTSVKKRSLFHEIWWKYGVVTSCCGSACLQNEPLHAIRFFKSADREGRFNRKASREVHSCSRE